MLSGGCDGAAAAVTGLRLRRRGLRLRRLRAAMARMSESSLSRLFFYRLLLGSIPRPGT